MPDGTDSFVFPPFRLDLSAECLWHGKIQVELRPKTWQLLRVLIENPGRLLTKDELLDAVWKDVAVTPASLNQAIREIRQALGDDARNPQFIQTVHRRGFRFIADVTGPGDPLTQEPETTSRQALQSGSVLLGRDSEIAALDACFEAARAGQRQIVFITGEPGIGKTRLLQTFLHHLESRFGRGALFVGGGQCVELLGESEAYLPVLDAIDRLGREEEDNPLTEALQKYAPSWLTQLPWLIEREADGSVSESAGTPSRMLREFCVTIEALAELRPTAIWLEDLHWSDPATIDLLAALARRTEPARLLVIATFRPVDAAMSDHPVGPLKRQLVSQPWCHELALEMLTESHVRACLTERFGELEDCEELPRIIHDHTDGNPLFLNTMVEHMVAMGWIERIEGSWHLAADLSSIETELPHSLNGIVESQLDGMTEDEVSVLEAASVVGGSFDVQAVAAALKVDVVDADSVCGRLARWGRFLETAGSSAWPDGTAGQRYRFHHDVFHQILYSRTVPSLRQRYHLLIGAGIEAGFQGHHPRVAAELALHFRRGGDPERAIDYLSLAADGVRRRYADREAVSYIDHALHLIESLPPSPDRDRRECDLRRQLARALVHSVSYTAAEQVANTDRLIELGAALGDAETQLVGLAYRLDMHLQRGDLDGVRTLAQQSLRLAGDENHPVFLGHAYQDLGMEAGLRGEHSRSAEMCTRSTEFLQGIHPRELSQVMDYDLAVFSIAFQSWAEWMRGRPEGARRRIEEAQERAAHEDTTPFGIAIVLSTALTIEYFRRDRKAAHEVLRDLEACLEEYGLPVAFAQTAAAAGWLRTADGDAGEGIEYMTAAAEDLRSAGMVQGLSVLYATIAETESARGRTAAGFKALDEAMQFVEGNEERFWEAEIRRIRGELLRLDGDDESAEESFRKSLDVAAAQEALSLELRAATSLARLLSESDRTAEGRAALSGVLDRFTEGFETLDFLEAKEVLDSL